MKFLAIDIGGTAIKFGLIDENLNISEKGSQQTITTSLDEFKKQLFSIINKFNISEIDGIGISTPGTVDIKTGTIYFGGALPFLHNFHMAEEINKVTGIRTIVENDAKAATIAELSSGNLKNIQNGMMIVLGTAVGSGVVIDGKLVRGKKYQAGEISFAISDRKIVSEESFIAYQGSGVNLIHNIQKEFETNLDGADLFDFIAMQKKHSIELNSYGEDIAKLIFTLHAILDLEKVVIGGGISNQSMVISTIKENLQNIYEQIPTIDAMFEVPEVLTGKYKSEANLIGSVLPLIN